MLSYDDNGPVELYYTGYEKLSELYETVIAGNTEYINQGGVVYTTADDPAEQTVKYQILPGAQEYNGHSYLIIEASVTWADAESFCERYGGHLVSITSQGEQEFVASLVEGTVWIGAFCDESDNWNWGTGEAWVYENWDEEEPDGDGEAYGSLHTGLFSYGEWESQTDSMAKMNFVCEWE